MLMLIGSRIETTLEFLFINIEAIVQISTK